MIFNPYYPQNLPLTFFNTPKLATYLFPNVMSTKIVTTKGSQGVQMFAMAPQIIVPTNGFSTRNSMPYFQPSTRNPPSRFGNFWGGIVLLMGTEGH